MKSQLKNKNNKVILISSLILGVLVLTLGISFALLTFNRTGFMNSELIVGDIYMHYNGKNEINLENAVPTNTYISSSYFEFTIDGKNTTSNKDIYYEIILKHGDNHETRTVRIRDDLLKFRLVEVNSDSETELFTNRSYDDLQNKRIWVDTIDRNTSTKIVRTYRLYMWISDSVKVGNVNQDYTIEEWNNVFASIKVNINGDFEEKELVTENGEKASTIWLGDSLIQTVDVGGIGFAENYYGINEFLDVSLFPTIGGANMSMGGAAINKQSTELLPNRQQNTISTQITNLKNYITASILDASNLDLIIFDGGAIDIIKFLEPGFDVPINTDDGSHSILNDFRTVLEELNSIKELSNVNKNLKFMYLNPFDYSEEHLIDTWWYALEARLAYGIEDLKYVFPEIASNNIDDYKNIMVETIKEGSNENLLPETSIVASSYFDLINRAREYYTSIIDICEEYNVYYYDVSIYAKGRDDYYIDDRLHYNTTGYTNLSNYVNQFISSIV